jgi:hypothetical protein
MDAALQSLRPALGAFVTLVGGIREMLSAQDNFQKWAELLPGVLNDPMVSAEALVSPVIRSNIPKRIQTAAVERVDNWFALAHQNHQAVLTLLAPQVGDASVLQAQLPAIAHSNVVQRILLMRGLCHVGTHLVEFVRIVSEPTVPRLIDATSWNRPLPLCPAILPDVLIELTVLGDFLALYTQIVSNEALATPLTLCKTGHQLCEALHAFALEFTDGLFVDAISSSLEQNKTVDSESLLNSLTNRLEDLLAPVIRLHQQVKVCF